MGDTPFTRCSCQCACRAPAAPSGHAHARRPGPSRLGHPLTTPTRRASTAAWQRERASWPWASSEPASQCLSTRRAPLQVRYAGQERCVYAAGWGGRLRACVRTSRGGWVLPCATCQCAVATPTRGLRAGLARLAPACRYASHRLALVARAWAACLCVCCLQHVPHTCRGCDGADVSPLRCPTWPLCCSRYRGLLTTPLAHLAELHIFIGHHAQADACGRPGHLDPFTWQQRLRAREKQQRWRAEPAPAPAPTGGTPQAAAAGTCASWSRVAEHHVGGGNTSSCRGGGALTCVPPAAARQATGLHRCAASCSCSVV
jgi:hypothetical protein